MANVTTYRGVKMFVESVETKKELDGRKSPEGKAFLVLGLKMQNNNKGYPTIIFFPEEVFIWEGKELLPVENYKIENNLDPGQVSEGIIFFVVPEKLGKFKLKFGKRSGGEKADIELKV